MSTRSKVAANKSSCDAPSFNLLTPTPPLPVEDATPNEGDDSAVSHDESCLQIVVSGGPQPVDIPMAAEENVSYGHEESNLMYRFDENPQYEAARITVLSRVNMVKFLLEGLDANGQEMFKNSIFSSVISLCTNLKPSNQLIHFMLLHEVQTERKHSMWFAINKTLLRFGLSEFSEITGLECRFHVYNEEENVDMKELFGMPKCKLDQLEEKYSKLKKNDERKFKMALLLFIEFVLLGNDKKKFVSNLPLSLLKDMDAFNSYSWGRLVFNKTLDNLRDCEPTKYRASGNYCLSGFPLAFQVFILDSLPTLASLFATCVNEEATPLCLKWVSSTKGKMKCSFQTIKDTASSVAQDDIKTIPLNLEDPETEDDCKWWGDEVLDPAGYLCHLFKVGFHDVRVSRPGGHNVKSIKEVPKKEESESDDFATPPPPPPRRHILRLPRPQKIVKKEDVPKKRKIEEGRKRAASKKPKREQIVEEVSCPEEDMLAVATPPVVVVAPSSTVGIVVAPEMDNIVPTDALVAPPLPDPTTSNSEAVVEPPVPDPTSSNTEAVVAPPVSDPTTSTISTTKIVPDWVEDLKKQLQAQNQLLSELVKKVEQQDATINQVVMRQKAQTMAQHRIESQCFRIVTNVQRMAGSSKGTKVSKKTASQPPADAPKLEVLGVSSSSEETVSTEKPMPQPQSQPEPQPKEEAEVDQPKEEAVEEKPLPEVDVKGKGKVKTRGPRRMGLREKKPSDLVVSPYVVPVKIPKPPKHSFLSKKDRDAFYTWYLNPKTKKEFITGFQHSANKEHFKLLLQKTGWLWDCQLDEMITYLRKAVIEYPDVYGRVTIVPIPFVDYFNDVRYKQFLELKETGTFNYGEEIACYVLGIDPPFFSKSFFDVDTIYTAINTCGKHWIALQIDLLKWCVVVYDSIVDCMSDGDLKALLTPFLVMFPYILKINGEFGRFGDNLDKPLDYVRKTAKEVPQNNPSGSCGVFTIKHIQYLSSGRTDLSNICQEWVPAFREQFCSILYHREWVKPHESL